MQPKFAPRAPSTPLSQTDSSLLRSAGAVGQLRSITMVSICLAIVFSCLAVLSGCSGDQQTGDLHGLSERDRVAVEVATTEQINLGRQIESASQLDNAYEVCFEMCKRSKDSCMLSNKVCGISTKYPPATELAARCDVTRERCRIHRTMIPRICTCYE
jgi:hypothetical protein